MESPLRAHLIQKRLVFPAGDQPVTEMDVFIAIFHRYLYRFKIIHPPHYSDCSNIGKLFSRYPIVVEKLHFSVEYDWQVGSYQSIFCPICAESGRKLFSTVGFTKFGTITHYTITD